MKPTKLKEDYQIFKTKYEACSGLHLPQEYLERSDVYVFKKRKQIIGGFILGKNLPLRTVDVFISEVNKIKLADYFSRNKFCEVCCFWMDKKVQKNAFFNAKFWMRMAYTVKKQEKKVVLFGTNSKGLAKLYGYPKPSLLFHKDTIGSKETFVFLAKRDEFFGGVWELVKSKLFKKYRHCEFESKEKLKKELIYEVSK